MEQGRTTPWQHIYAFALGIRLILVQDFVTCRAEASQGTCLVEGLGFGADTMVATKNPA